ncbi:MAG TPA: cell wall hydrolase [Rhizomicrobium sp.]|nr:cell wall hydrolase [Rhizomicrobium sp.]
MPKKTHDAISRSDRVLVAAMAIILATASAAVGASMTYRPSTDKPVAPVVQAVEAAPVPSVSDAVTAKLIAEHKCLSEVLYYEARGEGANGQAAIAEVVFQRLKTGRYGESICKVVYEGAKGPGCQFSFTCNGDMKRARQPQAWHRAEMLAARILTGEVPLKNATGGAVNFHAVSVSPEWADTMDRTTQIGNHIFYRGAPRSRAS